MIILFVFRPSIRVPNFSQIEAQIRELYKVYKKKKNKKKKPKIADSYLEGSS